MKQDDLSQRLALMLAFQAMIAEGKINEKGNVERIIDLARKMDEFCSINLNKAFSTDSIIFAEDSRAGKLDASIAIYLEELGIKETTQLPEDRESLIQLYDRLQHRKARRMQWEFYATATPEKLADLVLRLLDEELEDKGGQV